MSESGESGAGAGAPVVAQTGPVVVLPQDPSNLPVFSLGGEDVRAVGLLLLGGEDVGLVFSLTVELVQRVGGLHKYYSAHRLAKWRNSPTLMPYLHGPAPFVQGKPRVGELVDDVGLAAMLVQLGVLPGEVRSLRDAVASVLGPDAPRRARATIDEVRTYLARHPNLLLDVVRGDPALIVNILEDPEMDAVREKSVLLSFRVIGDALDLFSGLVLTSDDECHSPLFLSRLCLFFFIH